MQQTVKSVIINLMTHIFSIYLEFQIIEMKNTYIEVKTHKESVVFQLTQNNLGGIRVLGA